MNTFLLFKATKFVVILSEQPQETSRRTIATVSGRGMSEKEGDGPPAAAKLTRA